MGIALLASMALERMDTVLHFGLPYLSISISLNVLLTLMIVVRLVLHSRSIRAAMGTSSGIGSLYRATVAMLIESSALYAVSSLLVIGLWVARGGAAEIFLPILCEAQVRPSSQPPRSPGRLSDITTNWIGYRSTAYHQTGR